MGIDNAIAGKVTGRQGEIGEISGKWNEVMEIRRNNVSCSIYLVLLNTAST